MTIIIGKRKIPIPCGVIVNFKWLKLHKLKSNFLNVSEDISTCSLLWKRSKDDGGAPIEYYQIERFETEKGDWLACGRTKENAFEAKGLIPGHEYRFRVSAVNRYGYSDVLESKEALKIGNQEDNAEDTRGT